MSKTNNDGLSDMLVSLSLIKVIKLLCMPKLMLRIVLNIAELSADVMLGIKMLRMVEVRVEIG